MSESAPPERYSTIADFKLVAQGETYDVAQVAGEFIIMARPVEIPPCDADLHITVEGDERVRRIRLPSGASKSSDWVDIERLPEESRLTVASSVEHSTNEPPSAQPSR